MSYCVNCGVELDKSASSCPLCDTPVINPNILKTDNNEPPFPERIEIPAASKNKYAAVIFSILMLIPNVVCLITNLLFTPEILWCIYVISSSLLFWFLFIFPFFMKKKMTYLILAIDAVATAAYIFVFYYLDSAHTDWFWKIALPLDAGFFLIVALLVTFFSKQRKKIHSVIAVLTAFTVLCVYICLVINLYAYSVVATYITLIIGVSSLILLLFFVAVERNEKLYSWLTRKFFY